MALTWAYRIGGTGTTLTAAQRDNNILCIYGAMSRYGFSTAAIAGMCGCFFAESGFNPGIYETSHGGKRTTQHIAAHILTRCHGQQIKRGATGMMGIFSAGY